MSLHRDLLVQARHLAKLERTRPKQSSLRRAISSAYYALFHLLSSEAARLFASDYTLISCICRTFSHTDMYEISEEFSNGRWPKAFDKVKGSFTIPQQLIDVAQAFVDLQQIRHQADYNLAQKFRRSDAIGAIDRAETAMQDWKAVRATDFARIYLACFLNRSRQWDKSR